MLQLDTVSLLARETRFHTNHFFFDELLIIDFLAKTRNKKIGQIKPKQMRIIHNAGIQKEKSQHRFSSLFDVRIFNLNNVLRIGCCAKEDWCTPINRHKLSYEPSS